MNKVRVLFFATLRQRAGTKSMELEIPEGTTVSALKEQLAREHPNLKESLDTVVTAINREYAPDEQVIPVNGEIAFFPPVSGG
jgi:molybdopterin converting factor subunit 1